MMGTIDCVYETPCGWCSKWDKKCDRKIADRGNRAKCKPVDDAMDETTGEYAKEILTNKACESESDHEWVAYGISPTGSTYICKKCHATKIYPYEQNDMSVILENKDFKEDGVYDRK